MRVLTWLHRWSGVLFALLFAMWFASGIVMHFVPFPARSEGPLPSAVDAHAAVETIDYDQWTVAGDFDSDRPLRRIALYDQAGTEIYVSSRSGKVVLTTTRGVRLMNYVGSIPHWVYATELRHHREAWSKLIWWLSLLATIGAATGVVVGLIRLGSGSIYRGLQHWHHIFGLIFAPFLLAWIFSGFLSLAENWPLRNVHKLDFEFLALRPLLRSIVIVVLCLCGVVFSLTGAVLAWRRLRVLKRQKNDATAEAICEAVTRANMRFVPTKTPEQQSGLVLHRGRHLFIRQQTSVINAIRAHLAEFGIVAPVGRHVVEDLLNVVANPSDRWIPEMARVCLLAQLRRMIRAWHRSNEMSMRLDEAPGVGPVLATALVAAVADPKSFRSGRNFSAWIGPVPKQHSSGGKNIGNISKQGDRYLRGLFVAGAIAVIRYAKIHGTKHRPRLTALLARRPTKVAAIALANKIARMVWAMMARGERYKEPVALAR